MPLTSSTLKTLIEQKIIAEFGSVGSSVEITPEQAFERHSRAIAKAVTAWIAANGSLSVSVTGVTPGGGVASGSLTAVDNL
jgi:hypothetical protein